VVAGDPEERPGTCAGNRSEIAVLWDQTLLIDGQAYGSHHLDQTRILNAFLEHPNQLKVLGGEEHLELVPAREWTAIRSDFPVTDLNEKLTDRGLFL
jgi:hypothetical protein